MVKVVELTNLPMPMPLCWLYPVISNVCVAYAVPTLDLDVVIVPALWDATMAGVCVMDFRAARGGEERFSIEEEIGLPRTYGRRRGATCKQNWAMACQGLKKKYSALYVLLKPSLFVTQYAIVLLARPTIFGRTDRSLSTRTYAQVNIPPTLKKVIIPQLVEHNVPHNPFITFTRYLST
jgi:hypothetical protein